MKKEYITVKDACSILGTTRQNIFYLKKHGLIKDFIQVHTKCVLYNQSEIENLKNKGYGKS